MSDFITIVIFVLVIIFLYILLWVFDWSEKDENLHDDLFMIVIALLGFPPLGILALIGNFLNFYPKARIENRISTCLHWYNEKYWNNQGKIVPPWKHHFPGRSYLLERRIKVNERWVYEHFLVGITGNKRMNMSTGEEEFYKVFVVDDGKELYTKDTSIEELQNALLSLIPQMTVLPAINQFPIVYNLSAW